MTAVEVFPDLKPKLDAKSDHAQSAVRSGTAMWRIVKTGHCKRNCIGDCNRLFDQPHSDHGDTAPTKPERCLRFDCTPEIVIVSRMRNNHATRIKK